MKLSAELILYTLEAHGLQSAQNTAELYFEGVRLTPQAGDYLCILPAGAVTPEIAALDCAILTIGEPSLRPKCCITVSETQTVAGIFDLLQGLFDRFAEFRTALSEAALAPDYRELANRTWEMSQKPVILMDGSLRILALAPDREFADDAEWTHMRKYGFASLEGLRSLRESGELNTLMHSDGPILYGEGAFSNATIVSSIVFNGACMARACMTGLLGALTPFDMEVMRLLSQQLERKVRTDAVLQQGIGSNPAYSVLYDLLRGMKLDNRLIVTRLGGLLGWKSGRYCVLSVPAAAIDNVSYKYYAGILENRLDCFCVHCEDGLAAVIHMKTTQELPDILVSLREFLLENGFVGGMSDPFEDVTLLRDHLRQASTALQYADGGPGLSLFSECAMRHLLSFFPQERIRALVHPALLTLREQDRVNGSELYETLRVYLENERSLVKTAKALFIHRNTLLYRLEKLHQLVELDLEDAELRLYLTLSFYMLEKF